MYAAYRMHASPLAVSLDFKREWFTNGTIALFDYVVNTLYRGDLITMSLDFSLDDRTPRSPVGGIVWVRPLPARRCRSLRVHPHCAPPLNFAHPTAVFRAQLMKGRRGAASRTTCTPRVHFPAP
jgi:hypothetical protein